MGKTVFTRGVGLLVPGLLCLLSSAPAWAEVRALSLPQVIEYSLQNNGDIKALRKEKGIRDAAKVKAGLLPNPTLEVEGGTGALTGNSGENNLSLGVSQEIILAGKREKRLALAERELEMYRWQVQDRERLLRDAVQSAFFDLILAEKRLALSKRFIALNQQLSDVTKERLKSGDVPELETTLVKVELARSEGKKMEAEKTLQQDQARLFQLIGLPSGENPAISGDFTLMVPLPRDLAALKQIAHENRPDLRALKVEKNKGDSDVILAEAESIPNLTAGLAVKRDTTTIELGGLQDRDTTYTVGVKLSMPIPLFDRNQGGTQEALAKKSSAGSRLLTATKTIEREVETAYASFVNTEGVLALYRNDILPQLEKNLQLTQEAYRLGEVGILAVIEEQKKFFEVNDGYLAALHGRQTALLKLETTVATDLTGGVQ